MSRWRAEKITLDIGSRQVVLNRAGIPQVLTTVAGDWLGLAAELMQILPKRVPLSVRVADCWARYWLLEPPAGITSLRDCRLLLNARFEALYGQSSADWLIQADWQIGRPMLACALPRNLPQALAVCSLACLIPALLDDWNQHCKTLPETGVWCTASDDFFSLLYWQDGIFRLMRQSHGNAVEALLVLELARLEAEMPSARFWSGDAAPADWLQVEKKT